MGPLDQYILAENALKSTEGGFALEFKSHWYRALPLSCMDFKLKIDGEIIDNEKLTIVANEKPFTYDEWQKQYGEYLFILDKAKILFNTNEKSKSGKSYDIEFNLDLYIPYILVGPQAKPLLAGSQIVKSLICQ